MNLSNKSIQSTVGNLLTIGSAAGTPTTGTLQNGVGQDVTSLTLDELQVNRLVQTQATIAANGTTLSGATLLSAGVNLVTSADSNNIAVKLPDSQLGLIVNVINTSSRNIEVFPFNATHSLVGLAAGASFVVPPDNQLYQFVCVQNPVIGVWNIIVPYNNQTATLSYNVNMTIDSNSPSVFSGIRSTTGNYGDLNPSVYQVYSGGAVVSREYILNSIPSGTVILDWNPLAGYTEYRFKRMTIKTNIPAGDLTTDLSQTATTLMGLTSNEFGTMRLVHRASYWDDTISPNSQQYSINHLEAVMPNTYSYDYNQGSSSTPFTHYIAQPTDLAYDPNHANNRFLKYEVSVPVNPNPPLGATTFNSSLYDWSRMFDANGNPIVYHQFNMVMGSSLPTSIEFTGEWEIEVEVR